MDTDKMTNLPRSLRARLHQDGLEAPLTVPSTVDSADGTRKLLVEMTDGERVETVLIPQLKEGSSVVTQCISSQVGCAMGCVFCASGIAGLKRQMTTAEIVAQLLVARPYLIGQQRVRNVVFMGMGEPLHNYAALTRALRLLSHPDGMGISNRRVTVSTSGLVREIDQLGKDFSGQVQLAVSLHSVDDTQRSSLMPINRKYGLGELVECLARYPLPKRRRITIEYTLIDGLNDDVAQADNLVTLLRRVPIKVNLIPMNPVAGSDLGAPTADRVQAFRQRLIDRGVSAFVRKTRGDDVAAACGQLVFHGTSRRYGKLPVRNRRPPSTS